MDGAGFLAGFRRGTYALTESGKVGGQEMPISVSFVDVNGDGLPDLVTADPAGVLRAYINSGTKTEPKFTYGEVIPIFPPQIAKDTAYDRSLWTNPHSVPKIALYDWNHNGTLDLLVGNYCGDILLHSEHRQRFRAGLRPAAELRAGESAAGRQAPVGQSLCALSDRMEQGREDRSFGRRRLLFRQRRLSLAESIQRLGAQV